MKRGTHPSGYSPCSDRVQRLLDDVACGSSAREFVVVLPLTQTPAEPQQRAWHVSHVGPGLGRELRGREGCGAYGEDPRLWPQQLHLPQERTCESPVSAGIQG